MSNTGANLKFNALVEVAFGGVTANYAVLLPLATSAIPLKLLSFSSSLNEDVYISFDGVTNNLRVFANSFKLYDLKTNDSFIENQAIYIKHAGVAPTSGVFVIESAHT